MKFVLLVFGVVVVVGAVLVGLTFMGGPKASCADGVIATSRAAEDSFNTKWSTFTSALRSGQATVTLTEEELTSRGARYLQESAMPASDFQLHLCPGDGKGQATMNVKMFGRDVQVMVTLHLNPGAGSPKIVLDSVQIGQAPPQVTSWLASSIVGLANLSLPDGIRDGP